MPLDWERIKAICFDVDGTLSDTDNHMVDSLVKSLHGIRWLIPGEYPNDDHQDCRDDHGIPW